MKRLFGLLLLAAGPLMAETGITFQLIPEYHQAGPQGPFSLPEPYTPFARSSLKGELQLRYSEAGVGFSGTLSSSKDSTQQGATDLELKELYLDTQLFGEEVTLGKKVISWGVGMGFRPLDLIQQEDRRKLFLSATEGVPLLAWEHFSAESAISLIYANPGRGQQSDQRDDESLALKYYALMDQSDLHAVLRLSRRKRGELGLGLTRIENDHFEWHASLLYMDRYSKRINLLTDAGSPPLAGSDPMRERYFDRGLKALIGGSWTTENGYSILLEAWHDGEAYRKSEWDRLCRLTQQQSTLLPSQMAPADAVYGNIAWSRQAFSRPNLLQDNLLLRLARDGERLDASLELLYTPEDGGRVTTLKFEYQSDRQTYGAGLRRYGGKTGSAYRLLPESYALFLQWQVALTE